MEQLDFKGITEPELHTRYRPDDPDTSHEAAASIYPYLNQLQGEVLDCLEQFAEHGCTDEVLTEYYWSRYSHGPRGLRPSGSTIRTRRSELENLGRVKHTGQKRKLRSGRKGRVWVATEYYKEASTAYYPSLDMNADGSIKDGGNWKNNRLYNGESNGISKER